MKYSLAHILSDILRGKITRIIWFGSYVWVCSCAADDIFGLCSCTVSKDDLTDLT